MRRIYTILHLYLIVAIGLHLLWLISKTTKRPTTSEFLQLFRTSAKFFQSAFFAILYQAFKDAPHSLCLAVASLIAFRLTIRMTNLRILRSLSQAENDVSFGGVESRQLGIPTHPSSGGLKSESFWGDFWTLSVLRRFQALATDSFRM